MDKLDKAASIKTKITDDNNLVDKKVRPSEPPPPTKPNIKTKILVRLQKIKKFFRTKQGIVLILLIVVGLGIGGYFIYKNISAPEKSKFPQVADEELREKILQSFPEVTSRPDFGYCAGGAWNLPLGYLQKTRNNWNPIGVIWERAHPGFANWQFIEPEKGQYNWEKIDEYVKGAQEKGVQILFTVWPFTDWDQEICNSHLEWQPNNGGKDPRDFLSLAHRKGKPCDMDAFKEFLRRLVERYDGDDIEDMSGLRYPVTHWEIGNEPDVGDDFFQGSAEDYFEILKVSYTTIKKADPEAKVLIAAIGIHGLKRADYTKWTDFDTLKLFELGAANYFDIMNGHSYGGHSTVKKFLEIYGADDKPMWVTEPTGLRHYRQEGQAEEELLLTIVQVFIDEAKHGVTRFFLGGSDTSIPILHKAANYIRYGELEPFEIEEVEKVEKKITGKCDCEALYDYYNTGPEVREYAQAIKEDCENGCGMTTEMEKGSCYARLAMGLYENGTWVGNCVCQDLAGKVRDWCYAHSTVVFRKGDYCGKVKALDVKKWCTSPPP